MKKSLQFIIISVIVLCMCLILFACKSRNDTPSEEESIVPIYKGMTINGDTVQANLAVATSSIENPQVLIGSDIYITVHIDNPDKFEIVSFTINNDKYINYMFESGSDANI